jgi:hypothetical protein
MTSKNSRYKARAGTCAFALLAILIVPLPAQGEELRVCVPGASCRLVSVAELEELRGGLDVDTSAGRLRLSIGIHRAVSINDQLVAASSLIVPDLERAARGRGFQVRIDSFGGRGRVTEVVQHDSQVKVEVADARGIIVQNGPGNVAPDIASFGVGAMPIVVQNTLDNQKLKTQTTIDASGNSLGVMRTLRINEALSRAVAGSGR